MKFVRVHYCATLTLLISAKFTFSILTPTKVNPNLASLSINNKSTPEIIFGNYSRHFHIKENSTDLYIFSKAQAERIQLTCFSEVPNRWIWAVGLETDGVDDVKIENIQKKRIDINKTLSYFFSNLTIRFSDVYDIETNFSCSTEIEAVKPEFVTCVYITQVTPEDDPGIKLFIRKNTHSSNCTRLAQGNHSPPNCSITLKIDTNQNKATCTSKGLASNHACNDFDECNSLIYYKVENTNCRGNLANLTFGQDIHIKSEIPQIVSCALRFDTNRGEWDTFSLLYPVIGKHKFVSTITEALEQNLIQIFTLSKSQFSTKDSLSKLVQRIDFAENETVQFVCRAAWFLYMEGFRMKTGRRLTKRSEFQYPYQDQQFDLERRAYFNVTLSTQLYGNKSWIYCEGPTWNSRNWSSSRLTISIYPSECPSAKMYIVDEGNNGNLKVVCTYKGWPRPNVKWIVPPEVLKSKIIIKNMPFYILCLPK